MINEQEIELEIEDDDLELDDELKTCAGHCKDCILLKKFDFTSIGYVGFEKVGEIPEILFVGEAPGMDELKQNRPFIGKAGSFLREELNNLGLKSYYLANAMQCHPKSGGIRTPEPGEVQHCSKNVKQYINEIQPKLVILLGRSAYEGLMEPDFYKGQSVTSITKRKPVEIDGVKYAVCFHPSYITRNGGKKSPQYDDFIDRLKSLINDEHKDTVPVVPFEIKNLDDLKDVLNSYMHEEELGFDYEGTSLSPFSENFKILGFSLAALNPARATYVNFHRPITDQEKFLLSIFLERKKPWAYNVNYELKVTWSKITNKFIPFNDVFMLCKIDCSPGRLKDNARKHVGADFWEELVTSIRMSFRTIFKKIDKLKKEIHVLSSKSDPSPKQIELKQALVSLDNAISTGDLKLIDTLVTENALLVKYSKLKEDISEMYKFCDNEQVSRGLTLYPNEWEAIPVELTGEYCCYDSYYTLLLKKKLWSKHSESYPYYISQAWAGSVMETYGMNWNDDVAGNYEDYYIKEANNCLFKLINMIEFGEGSITTNEKGKEVVVKSTDELRLDSYTIMNDNSVSPSDKLVKLKQIFNPLSNLKAKQAPYWAAYTTNFIKAITYFYIIEETILASPIIPDKAKDLIDKTNISATAKNLLTCDWESYSGSNIVQSRNIRRAVEYMIGSLEANMNLHLGKFKGEVIEWQFRAHKKYGGLFTTPTKDSGIDPDLKAESEWRPEFQLLYYLRRFKKVIKSRTTYINGKIGRKNVWLSTLGSNYNDPPKRVRPYFEIEKGYKLKENERWILDTDFNVCGANTLRWRAAIHTVPANSELKEIYEARGTDSLFMHYDNSQSEIRLLASLSQDKALLAAFADGLDVHLFIASKIYNKPMDKVTSVERKNAKSASFALLYGKSIQAFAEELMGGDLSAATKLFEDFYTGFPDVKRWIEARHVEAKRTGKVTTLFGNTLNLDMSDANAAMRDAQNWPIQNGSSALAAHCIYLNYAKSQSVGIPLLPMVFTHDSHDMEFYIPNLFEVIDNINECAVDIPKREFNIPMKIDLELGTTQGNTVKLEELEKIGNSSRSYHFSSELETVKDVIKKLSKYFTVEYKIDEEEKKTSSLEELFMDKKAFSKYLGVPRTVVSGKMTLTKIA